ncbi:hypothetical protein TRFO_34972 [Tritrichomonas foetus]|uniref:Rap-GAP domain-containing protein n=1 Tax=Tritrichomonas foetus TaxID=1144522 RepID=A0A1J4JJR9_9EUKA|nr:hypothetical protein TRFO_34972 [Tritrichomonas foetus]|eukprot:OHS98607.1 hypothetical protein TRFO_34972 [Tritrichomonas foetus]
MENILQRRLFNTFPEEDAKEVVETMVNSLMGSDFNNRLKSNNDIEFALEALLYSFNYGFAVNALTLFSKWLIDPTQSDAILDSQKYNNYIQQVFFSIPLIYHIRKTHSESTINATYNFLKQTIIPDGFEQTEQENHDASNSSKNNMKNNSDAKNNNKSDKNKIHPFTPETWRFALRCLIDSISTTNNIEDSRRDKEIRYSLMNLFINGILISDLHLEDANILVRDFFNLCYPITIISNTYKESDASIWDKLFKGVFTEFVSFPSDSKKRNFIANLLIQMKRCAKEYEEKITLGQYGNLINWPIRAKYFLTAFKIVSQDIYSKNSHKISKQKLPGDSFMKLLGDCIFITPNWEDNILTHLDAMFKLFSWGDFSNNSQWISMFIKYLCYYTQQSKGETLFNTIYGIMNASPSFLSIYPTFFNQFVDFFLSKAAFIEYRHPKEKHHLLCKGTWVNLMTSLLEIARSEENFTLEKKVQSIIHKFSMCSELPYIRYDFNVYRLILLATAGNQELFSLLVSQEAPIAKTFRDGRVWDFELLVLAMSPYYMPSFSDKIVEKHVIEHILTNFENNDIAKSHNTWLLIALYELSKSTNIFIKHRSIVPPVLSYLNTQMDKINISKWVKDLIEIVSDSILIPTISVNEMKEISQKYHSHKDYILNNRVVTFNENQNNRTFGTIVRGPFGISSFEIAEQSLPELQPAPENTLKENILHLSDIVFPDKSQFPEFKPNKTHEQRSCSKSFLISLGLASSSHVVHDSPPTTSTASLSNATLSSGNSHPSNGSNSQRSGNLSKSSTSTNSSSPSLSNLSSFDTVFRPPTTLKPGYEEALTEFDECCELVPLEAKVTHVSLESDSLFSKIPETPRFNKFLTDLGSSFKMGTCVINYCKETSANDILIVFNETGSRINTKLFKDDPNHHLIISVSPIYKTLTKSNLMYKVTIIRSTYQCLILPFPVKKPVILSKKSMSRLISVLCFFYFCQGKDEIGQAGKKGQNEEPPYLISKYIESAKNRIEKLENVIKYQNNQSILDTIFSE